MITVLISGLLLGLGVGTSCMAFCAPVLVPHVLVGHRGLREGLFTSILFSLGRLSAYLAFALVLGAVGEALSSRIQSWLSPTVIVVGVLLLAYGFSIAYGHILRPNMTSKVCGFCNSSHSTFTLGVLMGLTPCLPLSMAMAYSLTLQNMFLSLAFFTFFWLGSSLYMIGLGVIAGAMGDFATTQIEAGRVRRISGIALASVGLIFLLEGFRLVNL